jgi:hypothetical protein
MRSAKTFLCILIGVCALARRISSQSPGQNKRIGIAASVVLDGKGHVLHDTRIVIEGSKIVAMGAKLFLR